MTSSPSPAKSQSISSTILAGVKLHDDEAWNRLYAIWHSVIYDWCRRAGVPAHDAQDVAQNVFLKVSRSMHSFERQSFRAWIHAITRNTVVDYFRNSGHRPVAFGGTGSWIQKIEDNAPSEEDEDGTDPPGNRPEPAPRHAEWSIVHGTLEVICNDFRERTFQAFERTTVDGRSAVDVADELGMTPEAVRAARYRVLKRLREELKGMQ